MCHADVKSSILYAALAVEIMLLCYGIVKSILALLRPWMPVVFHDMDGIAVMLVSEAASLALSGFCYYVVYRYFFLLFCGGDAADVSGYHSNPDDIYYE